MPRVVRNNIPIRQGEDVPQDVIHVRVHPSVRVIHARAFISRIRLISVEFHNGIKVIEMNFPHPY
jgi:hypothetical protein